jgi:hypothetical protein
MATEFQAVTFTAPSDPELERWFESWRTPLIRYLVCSGPIATKRWISRRTRSCACTSIFYPEVPVTTCALGCSASLTMRR